MSLSVSFLASRFPNPSETFIQDQVEGLLTRGADVRVAALARGPEDRIAALHARWGERLQLDFVPVGRTLLARLAKLPAALSAPEALDVGRFGEDAASLRLAVAAAGWPKERLAGPSVWLAHYGRWGRFACALRDLGLIEGPVATVFHGKDMSAYLKRRPNAYAPLFAKGDLFLPISQLWRDKLLSLGAPPEKTLIHRMGVDSETFTLRPRALAPGETVRLISVGRFVEKKGFDDAIAAFAEAIRAPGAPPASLTMIGGGALKPRCEQMARDLGLGAAVRFTGLAPHAQVAAELDRAHLFVLPSKTARDGDMEGVPVALMEAQAMGLPVLSTRHSGIPELVEHEVTGLLCAEGDRAGLAANMAALMAAPERWAAMGQAGAARVRAEFDAKTWNDLLLERLAALAPAP